MNTDSVQQQYDKMTPHPSTGIAAWASYHRQYAGHQHLQHGGYLFCQPAGNQRQWCHRGCVRS